jgi:hypothetical protein
MTKRKFRFFDVQVSRPLEFVVHSGNGAASSTFNASASRLTEMGAPIELASAATLDLGCL